MHDKTYSNGLSGVYNTGTGYKDILAKVDLTTYRRIPWEDESFHPNDPHSSARRNIPFFLLHFYDPDTQLPIAPCPRSFLKRAVTKAAEKGWKAMAGGASHNFTDVCGAMS